MTVITFGGSYYLIQKVYGRAQRHSVDLIALHFWLATMDTVMYIAALWGDGLTQGLMWHVVEQSGALTCKPGYLGTTPVREQTGASRNKKTGSRAGF